MDLIFDLGAHIGLNIPYYLLKANKVVAVEANLNLVEELRNKFSSEIDKGKLEIIHAAIVPNDAVPEVSFWQSDSFSFLSSLVKPKDTTGFDEVVVPTISVKRLFREYGDPDFVKIDLEGFDIEILCAMFINGIRPTAIQVEAWNPAVFGVLSGLGDYTSFKVVNSPHVGELYGDHRFTTPDGREVSHSFEYHSAGPVGDELAGPWFSAEQIFKLLGVLGPGWYDIHATKNPPTESVLKLSKALLLRHLMRCWREDGINVRLA